MACSSYYKITPCCGGTSIFFCYSSGVTFESSEAFYYDGPGVVGYGGALTNGQCYRVESAGSLLQTFDFPPLTQDIADDLLPVSNCYDDECPQCNYKLIFTPCCGDTPIIFDNDPDYIIYEFSVFQYTGIPLIFGNGGVLIPNGCYTITRELSDTLTTYPNPPAPNKFVDVGKTCGSVTVDCAPCTYFYQITNCADENETYCTTSNLSTYISNLVESPTLWPTIQVNIGSEIKCFYVTQVVTCDYPITVIPELETFIGCDSCQETLIKVYKLISCNDNQQIIYTQTDLSLVVDKIIKLNGYDECYYVTAYEGLSPYVIPVDPQPGSFESCQECGDPRYILEDCLGIADPIITQTDLSEYVDEVVKLKTCPDICWYVSESELTDIGSAVYIDQVFGGNDPCNNCIKTLPKTCATFSNPTNDPINIEYIGSSSRPGRTTVDAGETTEKGCYISWTVPSTIVVTTYGNCDADGNCPATPTPKRKVTPGYDTPACTLDYYEKVECAFSEWMYKDVLQKRYGISNCCPDELIKWEIKHEMLMLDSLINSDYICQEGTTCCPPTNSTCGSCGCNSCNY